MFFFSTDPLKLPASTFFLVKHGLVINKEYWNSDFSTITENEVLAINLDLSNNQNVTLATIYCPNGNPNLSLFQNFNNLSDVMFVGEFNSKLESFGCAKKNTSSPMLQNIKNQLNLIYLNFDEHTHMDRAQQPRHTRYDFYFTKISKTSHPISNR